MITMSILTIIARIISLAILVMLILPKAYQQTKINDYVLYFRWGIFIAVLIYTLIGVVFPLFIVSCTTFNCSFDVFLSGYAGLFASIGSIIISIILYIFYYIL